MELKCLLKALIGVTVRFFINSPIIWMENKWFEKYLVKNLNRGQNSVTIGHELLSGEVYWRGIYVLPQSSGRRPIFFLRINEISFRIKSWSLRIISWYNFFLSIISVRIEIQIFLEFLRVEISDWSGGFLSSGWAPGSKFLDDWGHFFRIGCVLCHSFC